MKNIFSSSIIRAILLLSFVVLLAGLLIQRSADTEIKGAVGATKKDAIPSDSIKIVDTVGDSVGKSYDQEITLSTAELDDTASVIDLPPVAPSIEENSGVGLGPFAPSEALKVQESFKVDPPMRLIGQDWKNGRKTSNFTMPVSEGRDLEIQVERFESTGEDGGEFTGTVVGAPGSTVNLSYRGTAEAGRIDIPSEGRSYRILPGKDGAIIVQDRNPSLEAQAGAVFPPVGVELPPVPDFIPPPPPSGIFEGIPRSEPMP
tara:strand:+ start:318 stop:1097 length:780 start_codon:yes stop_codon:yes gene_type:complete